LVDAGDAAIVDDGGGVVEVDLAVDEANDAGDAAQAFGDALQRFEVVVDETAAHEEIFRRVAGQRELRVGDDVGAELAGARAVVEDLGDVAFEVADGGVYLGEGDP
jgi:hypothetical protein